MNTEMEQYLRVFVNHQHDDRVQWLPLAEFVVNNRISESTKCTPFFAVQGLDQRMSFVGDLMQEQDQRRVNADQVQATMQHVRERLRTEMRRSQAVLEEGANRAHIPAPNIQIGSKVWVDAHDVRTTHPTRKLDWKRLGPFQVRKQMSPYAYELELLASIRIHQVQPVSLLDPVVEDTLGGQVVLPPPSVEVKGEEEYQVSSIKDSRVYRIQLQYFI
jgi:hypothetical protein